MAVRGSRRSRNSGAGFPLSDHADWNGLNEVVRQSEAERVFVVHGFADAFSRWLNEKGINAMPVQSGSQKRMSEAISERSSE
jgi:putative mRNA 3-end processing factor